jgi:transmembrane sensor
MPRTIEFSEELLNRIAYSSRLYALARPKPMLIERLYALRKRASVGKRRREAQAWVVRLDAGAISERQSRRLRAWLQSPENEAALRKAGQFWDSIDQAILAHRDSVAGLLPGKRRANYRRALVSAGVVGALGLTFAQTDLWITLWADGRTGVGETHAIVLSDGSKITLDSSSAVDIAYDGQERRVRLLEGRARFDVAPAPGRPFLVEAKGGTTRALGTIFMVDRSGSEVAVNAVHHDIAVAKGKQRVVLHPGQSLHYGDTVGGPEVSARGFDAWMQGNVVFENATLADVASALQRYSGQRLVVWGQARALRFSGVVRTADPIGALKAIAQSDGLSVVSLPGVLFITRR